MRHQLDLEAAEAFGQKLLGEDSWVERLFVESDGPACDYLWPAEFAALGFRFEQALGGFQGRFRWDFVVADENLEGRIGLRQWRSYAGKLTEAFGETRCRVAAERVLGSRKAENRKKVKNINIFDGFDADASLRLLDVCSKGNKDSNLLINVQSALTAKADPNAGLASPSFNDYTPLIFLSMSAPGSNMSQIATAMDVLIMAGADVHRECGQMPTGRLVPLRFAARLQNHDCLEALHRHVDLGDMFHWAAGENAADLMLTQLGRLYGSEVQRKINELSPFSSNASIAMRLFASPMVGGSLTPEGARNLCAGKYDDGFIRIGERADPNSPGLEGRTALVQMVIEGRVDVTKSLLAGRASPHQRDSSGATPLHHAACQLQPQTARALIQAGAELHALDHAGFSPWMLVGESAGREKPSEVPPAQKPPASPKAKTAVDPLHELMEMLRPRWTADELIELAEGEPMQLVQLLESANSVEALQRVLRLHESLFFNPRMVLTAAKEGRMVRNHLLQRLAKVLIQMLTTDPLQGDMKILAKYLLNATKGPDSRCYCAHVAEDWPDEDNREAYRSELMDAVKRQLDLFGAECATLRQQITAAATKVEGEAADENSLACAALLRLDNDSVIIPEEWREDPYWEAVQERQVLRFDPSWALEITDGASCCMQLLRLGVPGNQELARSLKSSSGSCAVTSLAAYSELRQVLHAKMQELYARGYVTYSNLCNKGFQQKMKEVAQRAVTNAGVDVGFPEQLIMPKRLQRLLEKTRDAAVERAGWQWPKRNELYLRHAACFYILDTVRLSFSCRGETPAEQVKCCMKVLEEFEKCTVEAEGVRLLRRKSGFASGVRGEGGYADVKLLCYTDLGVHKAFDGTEIPLRIIGEVQLILQSYEQVKHRMHLAYEVNRGSFDRKG